MSELPADGEIIGRKKRRGDICNQPIKSKDGCAIILKGEWMKKAISPSLNKRKDAITAVSLSPSSSTFIFTEHSSSLCTIISLGEYWIFIQNHDTNMGTSYRWTTAGAIYLNGTSAADAVERTLATAT
jgi:hypothetical protein